jgi:hypothetical protein
MSIRKVLSAVLLLISLLICSVIATAIYHLSNLDTSDGLDMARLIKGRVLHVFAAGPMWSKYPSLAVRGSLDVKAGVLTVPVFFVLWYLLRRRRRLSLAYVGAACAAAAVIPYLVGLAVLSGNTDPVAGGRWVSLQFAGALYCFTACAALCFSDLLLKPEEEGS